MTVIAFVLVALGVVVVVLCACADPLLLSRMENDHAHEDTDLVRLPPRETQNTPRNTQECRAA